MLLEGRSSLLAVCGVVLVIACLNGWAECLRIDCHPDAAATRRNCERRGCIWSPTTPGIPWCVFPFSRVSDFAGYDVLPNSSTPTSASLRRRSTPTLFGNDLQTLTASFQQVSDFTFRIRIRSPVTCAKDHELHPEIRNWKEKSVEAKRFQVKLDQKPFGIRLSRASSGAVLFDTTNIPGLTFSKQFIQFSTRVSSRNVYGLGEQFHTELRRAFKWEKWSLFTRDRYPGPGGDNLYSFQPFVLGLDDRNESYGIYVHNSHGMNVQFQPDPDLITFRIIGGELDVFVFLGPSPDQVVQQFTALVGRPMLPPYWALGFQLSKYGYKDLAYLKKVWDRNRRAKIPQDVQIIDIDYMDGKKDFTYDKKRFAGLGKFLEELHRGGRKLVPIVDPAIASRARGYKPLSDGLESKIFIRDGRTGKPLEGTVWPGLTYWPDFTNPATTSYWRDQLRFFRKQVSFDGIWLDMNDPSNFAQGSTTGCQIKNSLNYPPYNPLKYKPIFKKTICMDALEYNTSHYETHNYYGFFESLVTNQALRSLFPGKRPFVLSRSTAPGSGKYTAHWSGDNRATWESLEHSLVALLEFSMFGIPMMGSDICGFGGDTTEELCLRWSQVGAFYPYCRNHNDIGSKVDQDPGAWPPNTAAIIRDALLLRYSLLPYLYTLLFRAHTSGTTVARPIFFEFPNDSNTWNMHQQFLWGSSLMIAPILTEKTSTKCVYFPQGMWFDIYNGSAPIPLSKTSRKLQMEFPRNKIGHFLRGGKVVTYQAGAVVPETTGEARLNPFRFLVGLNERGEAEGELFWDDGESSDTITASKFCLVSISAKHVKDERTLKWKALKSGCSTMPQLKSLTIAGVGGRPVAIRLDGKLLTSSAYTFNPKESTLLVHLASDLKNADHVLSWRSA